MRRLLATLIAAGTATSLSLVGLACEHATPAPATSTDAAELDAAGLDGPNDAPPVGTDAGIDGAAQLGHRDRAGRPYIARWLVSAANRDAYNQEPNPFQTSTDTKAITATATVGTDITTRLAALDALDGKRDAPDASVPDLTKLLLTDVLIVDTTKPYAPASYLDVELGGGAHTTCGGRSLGEDVYDKSLSYFVSRTTSGETDGVAAPAVAPALTFPYLAAPQ